MSDRDDEFVTITTADDPTPLEPLSPHFSPPAENNDEQQIEHYMPRPLETSSVKSTPASEALVSLMARQMHERWAKGKVDDGWVYAPDRFHVRTQQRTTPP